VPNRNSDVLYARQRTRLSVAHVSSLQTPHFTPRSTIFSPQRPATSFASQLPGTIPQLANSPARRGNHVQSPYVSAASAANATDFLLVSLSKIPRPTSIRPAPSIPHVWAEAFPIKASDNTSKWIRKRWAVTRRLVTSADFLQCYRSRHEALQRARQLTNFRVASVPLSIETRRRSFHHPAEAISDPRRS
jgi:hypothetical protein